MTFANRILKLARAQGWRVERGTKHVKLYPPSSSERYVTVSMRGVSARDQRNLLAQLRRAGLVVPR